jgi:geranylgeranyl diphosphate synthase type II
VSFELKSYLEERRRMVDRALKEYFVEAQGPTGDVLNAMTYSLFAGGKRLRPILCLAGAEAVGGDERSVLPVACALELIHTYSLIHDDLPVMDDDELRRGKPTSHKVFGEAMALLAGDGLLTEAFRILADMKPPKGSDQGLILRVIGAVAEAAGYRGMIGGQAADIQAEGRSDREGKPPDKAMVEFIHEHKTADLITVSTVSGATVCGADEQDLAALTGYGRAIGLAFQISDDILNIEGDSRDLGKGVGSDAERGKLTYPAVFGLEESKRMQRELVSRALDSLEGLDSPADPLRAIAAYVIERKK